MNRENQFIGELSQKASKLSVEDQVLRETDEKIFARTCQLIATYGIDGISLDGSRKKMLVIPYREYDSLIEYANHIRDEFPPIFDCKTGDEIKEKASFTRLLEVYFKDSITEVEDFMGAVINKQLCVRNKVSTKEDDTNEQVVVEMICG